MPRPSWDEYFMSIAEQVAGRSTCLRRHTGAVLVKDKRILATGYNGTPTGLAHCEQVGCLREQRGIASGEKHELCRGIHAEQNAVIQAARHGTAIDGASVYSTHQPCVLCAKILINAGVTDIIFRDPYPDPLSEELLAEAGIVPRVQRRQGAEAPDAEGARRPESSTSEERT
jgi:dCMP deaminase